LNGNEIICFSLCHEDLIFLYPARIVIGLAGVLLSYKALSNNYRYQGSLIEPPVPAPDFSLITSEEGLFRLSDHKGRIVLLFSVTQIARMFARLRYRLQEN